MNILGIIAEFNPLHTGHAYLIQRLRRETGAAFCVVAMSGDYVQRGEPAFFSKFLRTRAALSCGADLVLELPLSVSTGSAEYFAQGAVSLLDRLGCITHLGFGSESGDIRYFQLAGTLLSHEPAAFRSLLQDNLKAGMSFPKARYKALSAFLTGHTPSDKLPLTQEEVSGILSLLDTPNNILGTEYLKALHRLHSSITPVTIKRVGAGYHENIADAEKCTSGRELPAAKKCISGRKISSAEKCTPDREISAAEKYLPGREISYAEHSASADDTLIPQYASASGLRKSFLAFPDTKERNRLLTHYIPESCHALYLSALMERQYVTFDDFFLPIYYTLQYTDAETLSRYQDVTPEFAHRLLSLFRQCTSVTGLCTELNSKNLTAARISRSLLHILLQLTKDVVCLEKEQGFSLYARILGFRKEAQPLLSLIRKNTAVPLVSKPADAPGYLSKMALAQLQQTIKASELYRAALPGNPSGSEYTQNIIIL